MTEHQRLFLVQARANFRVFEMFRTDPGFPHCHALHYLQMATEMLGKAHAWRTGPVQKTHRAFARFLRSLSTNRQAQKRLGFEGQHENWKYTLAKAGPLAQKIEDLAPNLARNGPNPEYPWPDDAPRFAPAEHEFDVWKELQETAAGRQFLNLTHRLFAAAEAFL